MRLYNGPTGKLAVVQATTGYRDLMLRLTNMREPPETKAEERYKRWFIKKMGWPTTTDVSILADLISESSQESTKALGALRRIVVAAPLLLPLMQQDINDPIECSCSRFPTRGVSANLEPLSLQTERVPARPTKTFATERRNMRLWRWRLSNNFVS